ncbi:MAG TPA: hypothetical protein VMG98_06790 [Verrucomicrobiae bacterium]|nr:hypothetical protein [Verrucomicrobiae bacterium]
MHFESIDEYLLRGAGRKADLIAKLLAARSTLPAAAPFYEGMRMLGARTPDLTLVALRLVLAGKRADDDSVVALRDHAQAVRDGGDAAATALLAYRKMLAVLVVIAGLALGFASPVFAQTPSPTPNLYRSLETGPSAHPAGEIRGRIESVDYPGGTFVVRSGSHEQIVAVVPATTFYQKHGGYATFADLHRGQRVDVSVYEVGDRLVAQSIRI